MEQVTFSNGRTETVYAVPMLLLTDLELQPQFQVGDEDTPETASEKLRLLAIAKEETAYLTAFQDVQVPKDWRFPAAAIRQGIQPPQNEEQRRLAYIRYGLLSRPEDHSRAQLVMFALSEEEVSAALTTFRPERKKWDWRFWRRQAAPRSS